MRRGSNNAHYASERKQSQNMFGASYSFPSQPNSTLQSSYSESQRNQNSMYQHTGTGASLSQSIDDHLREIRTKSSFDKVGRDQENWSQFESCSPHQRTVVNSGGVQDPSPGQFHGQQPLSGPANVSVSFPPPLPPPPFNPSVAPPGLPPFHHVPPPVIGSGISGQMFQTPPPPLIQQGFQTHQSQNLRMSPSVNAITATAAEPNIRPPASQNNFRMPLPPNRFSAVPSSCSFAAAPPRNAFVPPPPFLNQFPSSNQTSSQNSQPTNAFPIVQNSFPSSQQQSTSKPTKEDQTDSGKSDAQKEVDRWLQSRGKMKKCGELNADSSHKTGRTTAAEAGKASKKNLHDKLSIGEAQNKLRDVLHALAAVQGELQQVEDLQGTADPQTWEARVNKIKQLKEKYMETKQKVDMQQVKCLKRKLDQRRKKRERQKRRRQEDKEAEQQMLFERTQKHVAIDQWRAKIHQEYLNQQEMKRMKETADKTLSKVRREIREARKMLDTVSRLQKLRAVRNDTAEKRGQTFPPSVAEHFMEKTGDLCELLTQQIESFEKEEAALKLILETENKEAKKKKKEEEREKDKELRLKEMEEEQHSLFGEPDVSYPGDPKQPFVHYYLQAHYSLQALQNIRQEWDTFVVADSTPMASRIPDGWVIPETPSSKAWASAMQSKLSS